MQKPPVNDVDEKKKKKKKGLKHLGIYIRKTRNKNEVK